MKTTTLVWLAAAAVAACGSSVAEGPETDASTDAAADAADAGLGGSSGNGGSGGTLACPPKASACPEECTAILGQQVDLVNECLLPNATIACWAPVGVGGGLQWCVTDADSGVPYVTGAGPAVYLGETSDDWVECSEADASKYVSMVPCS
jgi:hypothetical protein